MSSSPKSNNSDKIKASPAGKDTLIKALIVLWLAFAGVVLVFTLIMFGVSRGLFGELPSPEVLENPKSFLATEIISADGVVLGNFYRENRTNVPFDSLSPYLVNALVATEDRRYYSHSGIDMPGLGRVLMKSVLMRRESSGGGSTISQQLAKNLFHSRPRNLLARIPQKLKEWVIAVRLEKRYTKEEILTMYLNTVEFVNNAHGIKSASRVYFSTTPSQLQPEQAAVLVGMVKNPSLYNPVRFPDRALGRRNVVLDQMAKYGYMEAGVCDSLKQLDLELHYQRVDHNIGPGPYFREQLRQFVRKWARENPKPDGTSYDIYQDGLKIFTTIDSRMQMHAEAATMKHMASLQAEFFNHWKNPNLKPWSWNMESQRYKPNWPELKMRTTERYRVLKKEGVPEDSIKIIFNTPVEMTVFDWKTEGYSKDTVMTPLDSLIYSYMILQPGFVAIDPFTGEVLAWVGGIDHRYFQLDHVTTRRQVGSTFKPFVYAAAITELGYSPCMKLPNVDFPNPNFNNWAPRNSDKYKDGEMIALWDALAHSVNKITAKLMLDLGDPMNVVNLVRRLGIESEVPPYPSIALGTSELTLLEMAGSYTAFVNRGNFSKPYYVTEIRDKHDNVIARFGPESREVLNAEQANVMVSLLQRVVNSGTGIRLRYRYKIEGDLIGKTGTTQENTDGWFIGATPEIVAGAWVGGDDPLFSFRSTALGQGASMALPIFAEFLKAVYADKELTYDPNAKFPDYELRRTIVIDCERYEQLNRDDYRDRNPYDDLF